MLAFLGYWSSSIVFCGLVFRGGDVIWPFRANYYALPLKWTFNAIAYNVFDPDTFSGATLCTPGETLSGGSGCLSTGFYCEGAEASFGCWGREGPQVLDTLHLSYESLTKEDNRVLDSIILLIMALGMKFGYVMVLWMKCSATDSPQKETGDWVRRKSKVGQGSKVRQGSE
jgi:hypothetical protein